jgi:recombination protein RecA
LVPSEEFEKGMESMQIGAQARMNSKMQRKFTALVSEYETAFVIITHLTTQIGTMSKDPLIVSGGNAIIFGASLILDFRKKAIQESDPVTREEAIKIGVSVKKNHCTPSKNPYLKTDYFAIFGEGIERYLETLDNAIEQGILVKSGSFIKDPDAEGNPKILPDGTKLQWQGNAKFREFCKQNPEWFESLIARTTGNAVQMSIDEIDEAKREEEEIKGSLGDDVIAEIEQGAEEGKKKKVNKRK